jgi:hypothetical protein
VLPEARSAFPFRQRLVVDRFSTKPRLKVTYVVPLLSVIACGSERANPYAAGGSIVIVASRDAGTSLYSITDELTADLNACSRLRLLPLISKAIRPD